MLHTPTKTRTLLIKSWHDCSIEVSYANFARCTRHRSCVDGEGLEVILQRTSLRNKTSIKTGAVVGVLVSGGSAITRASAESASQVVQMCDDANLPLLCIQRTCHDGWTPYEKVYCIVILFGTFSFSNTMPYARTDNFLRRSPLRLATRLC